MFAQLIKARLKPDTEEEFGRIIEELHALEQRGSGLVRSTTLRDQADPSSFSMMVVFDSEAEAREREVDPRRQPALQQLQARMAAVFDRPPEFVNFDVVDEFTAS